MTFYDEVPPITADELMFAMTAADAAATHRTPRQSFRSKYEEALESGRLEPGKHLVLSDIPMNHAAFAIMESFPEKTEEGERKRQGALWRAIFVVSKARLDDRFAAYVMEENGEHFINMAIVEAMATTPMTAGEEVPLDLIFENAAHIAERDKDVDDDDRVKKTNAVS